MGSRLCYSKFLSNVYIGLDIGSVVPQSRRIQVNGCKDNKNIVAYFINIININIINITIDQLDMKLRLRENSINTS